jgi:hypothetical protein
MNKGEVWMMEGKIERYIIGGEWQTFDIYPCNRLIVTKEAPSREKRKNH